MITGAAGRTTRPAALFALDAPPASARRPLIMRRPWLLALILFPTPALAQLPEPVRAMIEAAAATGDPDKVTAVVEVARTTNPADVAEINALFAAFQERQEELAEAEERREERALETAGIFENIEGEGEIGGSRVTGNSDTLGINGRLRLTKRGADWEHEVRALVDFLREDGDQAQERYLLSYIGRRDLGERDYFFGQGRFERARFQGYAERYALSAGLGHRYFDRDDLTLRVQVGPAYRRTKFIDGRTLNRLAALGEVDLDWTFAEGIRFTQDVLVTLASPNSTLQSETGLQARIAEDVQVRLGYSVEHNTDQPDGSVPTDTITRFSLVFGF